MDRKIAEIAETRKQFAERGKILEKYREHSRESVDGEIQKTKSGKSCPQRNFLKKKGLLSKG